VGRPAICGRLGGANVRTDLYTKTIITLIALLLAVIAMKPNLSAPGRYGAGRLRRHPILV
jgi:hypothetical protein